MNQSILAMNKQQESSLEYQRRIQKALTYIRENLDKPLSVKEVAKIACFSEYHFHRIFAAIMQETLGEYITRKKLERAAIRLAYSPDSKVSNVAFEFGYSSVSSFSKAFKQWFGCRPTEISKIKQSLDSANGKLQTKYEKLINSDQLYVGPPQENWHQKIEEINNRVQIKSISQFELYYLTNPGGYEFSSIVRTWKELMERIEDAKITIDDCEKFAISHDHPALTPSLHCRYDACIALPQNRDVELSLAKVIIPSGRYAIFPVEGPEESILDQYLQFYTVWMPQSGYEPDNFPVLEHYLPTTKEGSVAVELWAKITRLSPS